MGLLGGLALTYIYGSLHAALQLDTQSISKDRTAKQYRESKRKHKVKTEVPLGYISMSDSKPYRGRGLVAQTIMEEMDSDY